MVVKQNIDMRFVLFFIGFLHLNVAAQEINENALFAAENTPEKPVNEITVSLLLPFDEEYSNSRLASTESSSTERTFWLRPSAVEALDFYEGFLTALNIVEPFTKINVQVYDVGYNDTLLADVLSKESVSFSNIIIGPSSVSGARTVADYCKSKQIINIQPFVISKNIGSENPYLIKLEPSIEAHIERMFKTIVDSFASRKVFIQYSNIERSITPALHLDSLLKHYNSHAVQPINYRLMNASDTSGYRALSNQIDENAIVVYCRYETGSVEQNLRALSRVGATVFGMPTWIDNELLRIDYMNNTNLHFTNIFYADTALEQQKHFTAYYTETYKHEPSRASYLGYDVCDFLLFSIQLYSLDFVEKAVSNSYKGIGFDFSLGEVYSKTKEGVQFLYYGNNAVHQFRLKDYEIQLVE